MSQKSPKHAPRNAQRASSGNLFIFVGLLLIVGVVLAIILSRSSAQNASFVPQVSGAPRLEIETDRVDHGRVSYSTVVESVFPIRNVGDQPLKVLREPRVELVEGC